MAEPTFTVDTKLFRELGELLVGRESIALAELVKNAYDADATEVLVYGEKLDTPKGFIRITDNGIGMDHADFTQGFLRIAGRTRTAGTRRSILFKRRYTGAKGLGRLAAHKLARFLQVHSWKWDGVHNSDRRLKAKTGIEASIDWDLVEELETLDQISGSGAISSSTTHERHEPGTELTLERLRRAWTAGQRRQFHSEVLTLSPLKVLTDPAPGTFGGSLLFKTPRQRTFEKNGDRFALTLAGDLEPPDELKPAVAESAALLIEIDCDAARGTVRFGVAFSELFAKEYENASRQIFEVPYSAALPEGAPGVELTFQARVFERTDQIGSWPDYAQGIRVYMEGFRVPPYGERTDDWLLLKFDYTRRAAGRLSGYLQKLDSYLPEGMKGESAVIRTEQAYAGAVFLRQEGSPGLEMLINREGFIPGPSIDCLSHVVRTGLDIATRMRYAASIEVKRAKKEAREEITREVEDGNPRQAPVWGVVESQIADVTVAARSAREALALGNYSAAAKHLSRIEQPMKVAQGLVQEQGSEHAMLRVLASLGTQLAAFSHEIGGLVTTAAALVERLEALSQTEALTTEQKRLVKKAIEGALGLRHAIDRQAIYLIDVTSIDARRRRSRQKLHARFGSSCALLGRAIENEEIAIRNEVPEDLETPPMFPAEITMVMTNLLSNAVKAAGRRGIIRASARETDDGVFFVLDNTGQAVDLRSAERWFEPFQSTTTKVRAGLGQGMGLGLTITRSIVDEYGADIQFVRPTSRFASAIQIHFPKRQRK